jgi:lipopolysaccharide/colanic/teichoic acid biosynthesis glycosyltransferase
VFYRQERIGKNGRPFALLKFRTMVQGAEALRTLLDYRNEASGPLFKVRDDPRITPLGRWLRRLSIDELPQLLNVMRGEMSLVGPRPPLATEVALYEDWHRARLEVRPGITGLWQVGGRSNLSFDDYVRLDLFYIENWSITYDLFIMAKTIPAVVSSKGAF